MADKEKVNVKINGVEYTLVAEASVEYIHKIADYVDKKMHEIMGVNSSLSTAMAAVLTSVNIADELHKQENGDDKLREELIKYAEEYKNLGMQIAKYEIEIENLKREISSLRNENNSLRHNNQRPVNNGNNQQGQKH